MSRRKPEVRREEILRATCDEVARRGFANTRASDVAASLGVSTALIFYHFDSKERLLSDALAFAAERDLVRLDAAAGGKGSACARLGRILRLYAPVGSSPGWTLWIDAWAAALRSRELAAVSRRLDVRWKDAVAAVITEGVASGEMSCSDASGAAWRITALLDGLAIQTTVHPGVLSRRQMNSWVQTAAEGELGLAPGALRS